jgi:WD40 repeat protein
VAFSPNSKLLATASRDKTIRVYNAENGSSMHKLTGHNDHIRGLCFTPKGELVSASLDETALVFGMLMPDSRVRWLLSWFVAPCRRCVLRSPPTRYPELLRRRRSSLWGGHVLPAVCGPAKRCTCRSRCAFGGTLAPSWFRNIPSAVHLTRHLRELLLHFRHPPLFIFQSRYAQLVAVGCADGNVSFIDLSFTSQQPLFREARMVRRHARTRLPE